MNPDYFYLNNVSDDPQRPIPLIGYFLTCSKCGRKVVVEIALCGTNHNMTPVATCAECMQISENFREKYPEQSKMVDEFCGDSKNA